MAQYLDVVVPSSLSELANSRQVDLRNNVPAIIVDGQLSPTCPSLEKLVCG